MSPEERQAALVLSRAIKAGKLWFSPGKRTAKRCLMK
ncbi:MAG: hypothetical protein ACLSFZ_03700 [Frisingicoccus sp.]